MKIFTAAQIRAWDAYTIAHEPISSQHLMERAASAFVDWFIGLYPSTRPVVVFAGTGNNGGDGVAAARLLSMLHYEVSLHIVRYRDHTTPDFESQYVQLPAFGKITLHEQRTAQDLGVLDDIPSQAVLIDALFGTGLNRSLEGAWVNLIQAINELPQETVSIDLPSGLLPDEPTFGPCIEANYTFTFQVPKLALLLAENARFVGEWHVGDIGLHRAYAITTNTPYQYVTEACAQSLRKRRPAFAHKGIFGHALLIVGSYGKMGAAVLAAKACLRAGVGLLTVHAPRCGNVVLQTAVPEAMYSADHAGKIWKSVPPLDAYQAIGAGCGIGTAIETAEAFGSLLKSAKKPLVLDADALNLLATHPEWWSYVPAGSILTPHPKEFSRLFGDAPNGFARLALLREKAKTYGVIILLKGAYTAIATPEGCVYFNSTGNPGMATAGSGDVLTGILTALLAQGYMPEAAAVLGTWAHGTAGDAVAAQRGQAGVIAGDLVEALRV